MISALEEIREDIRDACVPMCVWYQYSSRELMEGLTREVTFKQNPEEIRKASVPGV